MTTGRQVALNLLTIYARYRRELGDAEIPPLLGLAVNIQECGLDDQAHGDQELGDGSWGPYQLYQAVHPGTTGIAVNPWYDYGYPEVRDRWLATFATLGGREAWEASGVDRGAFIEAFAPDAQGSVRWSANLGTQRYNEACAWLEALS